ncbi:hypothetical protein [Thermaerobacillus caldiproteolyticus]|uniref:hypothetical protein n=1 Tax=Thermaerobacillus caldiproteolyticus TaxID=247480 RepID=UPI001F310958|nr:hypothetical protein [Anoxybacillus caldiproteolyticus]
MRGNIGEITVAPEIRPTLVFQSEEDGIVITPSGDFFYKGKLVKNDKKIYEAMVDFLKQQGFYK